MFNCFCPGSRKKKRSSQTNYQEKILPCEKQLLKMIYEDLANRCPEKKLTHHNFMLFFPLMGLWGQKLFRFFAGNSNTSISFTEFYMGINKIARGTLNEKILILFNFIKQPYQEGINYRQFLKMLYHYSKNQLKDIMISDGVFIHQSIIPSDIDLKTLVGDACLRYKSCTSHPNQEALESSFQKAYKQMINAPAENQTSFFLTMGDKKIYIGNINMNSVTEEFAKYVFKKNGIDIQRGIMTDRIFKQWVLGNKKFYETFFAIFHQRIWGYTFQKPNFLDHIEKQTAIQIKQDQNILDLYMMLVQNVLIFSFGRQRKEDVFKIICLDGLTMSLFGEKTIQIINLQSNSEQIKLYFADQQQTKDWLNVLNNFSKDYLHTKYKIEEAISTGRFSVIYKCYEKESKKSYALKVINKSTLKPCQKLAIETEIAILKIIKNPLIINYKQDIYSKQNIYIVMERIFGEDLFQYVKRNRRLSEFEAAFILGQIIQAVIYLHSLQIIHRDLKPENIMVSFQRESQSQPETASSMTKPVVQEVKIIDFGFASYKSVFQNIKEPQIVGTYNYLAPELLGESKPDYTNDIFSIGAILYFMLCGQFAFYSDDIIETMKKIETGDFTMNGSIWDGISQEAKDLVESMLQINPVQRISLKNALNHPWFLYANSQS